MAKTAVVPCKCSHEFQDKRYGKGNRVANETAKQNHKDNWAEVRCTVCKATHRIEYGRMK